MLGGIRRGFATKSQLAGYKKRPPPPTPVPFKNPQYKASPSEELAAAPHLLHRTKFESQFVVNRRLYNEQVHELRKIYIAETAAALAAAKEKKQQDEEAKAQQVLDRKAARLIQKQANIAAHLQRAELARIAKKERMERNSRIREAHESKKLQTQLYQLECLAEERGNWIEKPSEASVKPFLEGNEFEDEPGFWPSTTKDWQSDEELEPPTDVSLEQPHPTEDPEQALANVEYKHEDKAAAESTEWSETEQQPAAATAAQ